MGLASLNSRAVAFSLSLSLSLFPSGRHFEGLLFEGNTTDKSWTLVFQKHVTMTIRPPGCVAKGGTWSLIATQKDEPVSLREAVTVCA